VATLLLEARFGFLDALDRNFQNGCKRRAPLNKKVDVFSVEADQI
jgi:hypothetical protein